MSRYTRRDRGITRDRYGWRVVIELDPDPVTGRRRQVSRHRRTKAEARAVLAELLREHHGQVRTRFPGRQLGVEPGPVRYQGPRFDLGPVLDRVSMSELARALEVERTVLHRWQAAGGVSVHLADRIACEVLGLNPAEVWGASWWESAA